MFELIGASQSSPCEWQPDEQVQCCSGFEAQRELPASLSPLFLGRAFQRRCHVSRGRSVVVSCAGGHLLGAAEGVPWTGAHEGYLANQMLAQEEAVACPNGLAHCMRLRLRQQRMQVGEVACKRHWRDRVQAHMACWKAGLLLGKQSPSSPSHLRACE
jgi:hypothetical protein